jgi:hypothetical protein
MMVGAIIALLVFMGLFERFVRVIPVPSAHMDVPVSVGYERTESANNTYARWNDWEMLHDRGPTEDTVQELWTFRSIFVARSLLFLSYFTTLACILSIVCMGAYRNALEDATKEQ